MIVYVHGLWLTGVESAWLRRRLALALDCEAHAFHYRSVTATVGEAVEALREFIIGLNADAVHLVGHSLGGIVLLRLLESFTAVPPGRVVLLGSPVNGSCVARGLACWRLGSAVLGRMVEVELLQAPQRRWEGGRDLGLIAGSQSLGLGRVVAELPHPNDGTVAVVETELPGATDRIVLPVSHTGMLFSAEVVRQTACFLRHGRFDSGR
jgi:pimeloyl-ACP methyl ester carboxylesterase